MLVSLYYYQLSILLIGLIVNQRFNIILVLEEEKPLPAFLEIETTK